MLGEMTRIRQSADSAMLNLRREGELLAQMLVYQSLCEPGVVQGILEVDKRPKCSVAVNETSHALSRLARSPDALNLDHHLPCRCDFAIHLHASVSYCCRFHAA